MTEDRLVMVGSVTARSVCPPSHAPHASTGGSAEGIRLVAADGSDITRFWERLVSYALDGRQFGMSYKEAGVRKPVVGVSQAVDRCVSSAFSSRGSYMMARLVRSTSHCRCHWCTRAMYYICRCTASLEAMGTAWSCLGGARRSSQQADLQ